MYTYTVTLHTASRVIARSIVTMLTVIDLLLTETLLVGSFAAPFGKGFVGYIAGNWSWPTSIAEPNYAMSVEDFNVLLGMYINAHAKM